jgi:sporulation protein YlmC with PRC-barrel domain
MAMAEPVPVTIGAEVSCTDGVCGRVTRVVVDPIARTVTHLVVEPMHHLGLSRLVPLDLVDASSGQLSLRCSGPEFDQLDPAEESEFLPGIVGYGTYGPAEVMAWPYYGLGSPGLADEMAMPQTITYDTFPPGEVEVRRGAQVQATDGTIGQVQGLVIEPRSHRVTHVLLKEGHLWGRKEVAIPVAAVTGVDDDGVRLSLSKREVAELPPVEVNHLGG